MHSVFSSPTAKQGMASCRCSRKPLQGPISPRRQSSFLTLDPMVGAMVGDWTTSLWKCESSEQGSVVFFRRGIT